METLDPIFQRRSIRKFKEKEVPRKILESILEAAIKAPSGKNLQPWSFVVLNGKMKKGLIKGINKKLAYYEDAGVDTGSARASARVMEQASAVILIFNTGVDKNSVINISTNYRRLVDIQSIGGMIQTLLLAAQDKGIGSLWICDIYYADQEICDYVKKNNELIAAVALGYADQSPPPRPRKDLQEIVQWMD